MSDHVLSGYSTSRAKGVGKTSRGGFYFYLIHLFFIFWTKFEVVGYSTGLTLSGVFDKPSLTSH